MLTLTAEARPQAAQLPPPAQAGKTPPPPPPLKEDPKARQALADAIKRFNERKDSFTETELWQRMDVQGLRIESEGQYVVGPGDRLRLDLHTRVGDTRGRLQVACDGTTLWDVIQLGDQPPQINRVDWKRVRETLGRSEFPAQLRNDYIQGHSFEGLLPLLKSFEDRVTFTEVAPARWDDRDVQRLTGYWSAVVTKTPPTTPNWPAFTPRKCVLYLDPKTGWPYRVEWWGPAPPLAEDRPLLQMEYRNPKLNFVMTPGRAAKLFKFDPGTLAVEDATGDLLQRLSEDAMRLKGMKKGR